MRADFKKENYKANILTKNKCIIHSPGHYHAFNRGKILNNGNLIISKSQSSFQCCENGGKSSGESKRKPEHDSRVISKTFETINSKFDVADSLRRDDPP